MCAGAADRPKEPVRIAIRLGARLDLTPRGCKSQEKLSDGILSHFDSRLKSHPDLIYRAYAVDRMDEQAVANDGEGMQRWS